MYTNFRIQNFRGFKDFELKDIKRVNLIAGKNNVGKTSLLEAILTHAGEHYTILDRTRLRGVTSLSRRKEIVSEAVLDDLKVLFRQFDIYSTIHLSAYQNNNRASNLKQKELSITFTSLDTVRDTSLYPIRNGVLETSAKDIVGLLFKMDEKEIDFVHSSRLSPYKRSQATLVKSYINVPTSVNRYRFSMLKRERRTEFLVDTLKVIEPHLRDLELLDNGIYGDVATLPELIPLNSIGQGFGRVITILLAISAAEDGIVAIDEVENGLHYSIQTDVWKAIAAAAQQFNVQVFATTHSREMIQAAYEAFKETSEDDFRFHRLDRDKHTGEIYPTTYDSYSMEAAMDVNAEVR